MPGPRPDERQEVVVVELLTIGHGASDRDELRRRLLDGGVQMLVDVRRFPGSRRNPDVGRDALDAWVPQAGVEYVWDERLGGRRTLPPDAPDLDDWWRVESFRAYAAHTRTEPFRAAVADLLERASTTTTAVMCSENVWWRCHRRLIADVVVLGHGVPVRHLMPDGRSSRHEPSQGAQRLASGELVWPAVDA